MPAYFDSSVVLAILLNDSQSPEAYRLWGEHEGRVSSVLLEVEGYLVLRRKGGARLSEREEKLKVFLSEVSLTTVGESVLQIVRSEPALSICRTLDAVHLATTLFIRRSAGSDFVLCTLDKRMASMGRQLGLKVLPA